ncbi:MAG: S8 family serine peptidase [Bacteriovoracaceae bacterium]
MRVLLLSLVLGLLSQTANASVVAIIDSGTDYLHNDLQNLMWNNPGELAANNRDEDMNGFVDDVFGWNFAENNNKVIDYKYLGTLNHDIRKFFDIQAKMIKGFATKSDLQWIKDKRKEPEFIKSLQVYGNFMHGTHVAGIAAVGNDEARILAVKLIPTEVQNPFPSSQNLKSGFAMTLLKMGLSKLAEQQMKLLIDIAGYVASHGADVANGSFGTGFKQAEAIVGNLAKMLLGRDPTPAESKELTSHFINTLVTKGKEMVAAAPDTLFVWAAGNDGTNNDDMPTSPANIEAVNSMTVAATVGTFELASFSNYGIERVDVAAPGVGIQSTVPGSEYLRVSGTSQAAPYVSKVAGLIKDENPDLLPRQIKKIIMKTVDVKPWLADKVRTSGIVNLRRAVAAAQMANSMRIDDAIDEARRLVSDMATKKAGFRGQHKLAKEFVLPLPSQFKLQK